MSIVDVYIGFTMTKYLSEKDFLTDLRKNSSRFKNFKFFRPQSNKTYPRFKTHFFVEDLSNFVRIRTNNICVRMIDGFDFEDFRISQDFKLTHFKCTKLSSYKTHSNQINSIRVFLAG